MPAAITISVILESSASTAKAWKITKSCWVARARRMHHSAKFLDPRSMGKPSLTRSKMLLALTGSCASRASGSSRHTGGLGPRHSRNGSMRTNPLYDPAAGSMRLREAVPEAATPRVFRNSKVIANDYQFVADDAELPDGAVIVSTKRFLADRPSLLSRHAPLGVRLDTSQSPEILSADLT